MVHWTCSFKLPTKKASSFIIALKRAIKKNCGFAWTIYKDVGKRITKVTVYAPTFGYRVDLNTPWAEHRKAEKRYNDIVGKTDRALLDIAERHGAKVEVYRGIDAKSIFVTPKEIREAEQVEEQAVKIVVRALKKIKKDVETQEILTIDGIVADAKRHI